MIKTKATLDRTRKLLELVRVYKDLERTLRELKSVSGARTDLSALKHIDVGALIHRLSQSKRRLERKIGNSLVLEAGQMKRKLDRFLHAP